MPRASGSFSSPLIFLKKSEHDNAIHPVHPRLRLHVLCAAEAGEILVELVEIVELGRPQPIQPV